MPIVFFKGDNVYVDGVDINREARNYRALHKGPDGRFTVSLDQALEVVAKIKGFDSYHALRNEGRRKGDTLKNGEHAFVVLAKEALTKGARFPANLPQRLSLGWQVQAVSLIEQALAKRNSDNVEIVVLVGATGSGKTTLARYMVHKHGGAVMDASLAATSIPDSFCKDGAVLVYDRPAELPKAKPLKDSFSLLDHRNADGSIDLHWVRLSARMNFNPFGMHGLYVNLIDQVLKHPKSHFVVSVPTEKDVRNLLTCASGAGSFIWKAAHVVNLDTLQLNTMYPPSMEEWEKEQKAFRREVEGEKEQFDS